MATLKIAQPDVRPVPSTLTIPLWSVQPVKAKEPSIAAAFVLPPSATPTLTSMPAGTATPARPTVQPASLMALMSTARAAPQAPSSTSRPPPVMLSPAVPREPITTQPTTPARHALRTAPNVRKFPLL